MAQQQDEIHTLLAQIADDDRVDGVSIPSAPANDNTNTTDNEQMAANEPSILDTTDLNDKIDLITDAAIGGLDKKKAFIMEKLQFYADEKLQQFIQIDESCR